MPTGVCIVVAGNRGRSMAKARWTTVMEVTTLVTGCEELNMGRVMNTGTTAPRTPGTTLMGVKQVSGNSYGVMVVVMRASSLTEIYKEQGSSHGPWVRHTSAPGRKTR